MEAGAEFLHQLIFGYGLLDWGGSGESPRPRSSAKDDHLKKGTAVSPEQPTHTAVGA